jgi:(p)ppGpp synthase/HD superfamily hydrolase
MILSFNDFIAERYTLADIDTLNQHMKARKVKHSCKVAELTKELTDDEDVYYAALYHDYLERGGSYEELGKVISKKAYSLVLALTKDGVDTLDTETDNVTLAAIKAKFHRYDAESRNALVIIKLCDRVDNLKKRRKRDELSKKYIRKSVELVEFLCGEYTGDTAKLDAFIAQHLVRHYKAFGKLFGALA